MEWEPFVPIGVEGWAFVRAMKIEKVNSFVFGGEVWMEAYRGGCFCLWVGRIE